MLHLLLGVLLRIDPAHSKAAFSVQHIFVDHVTGTLPIVSGTIEVPAGSTIPVHVTAVLDPTKIRTGESDRDGVLQTPDWFDTPQYPTWTFVSTKITPAAGGFTMDGLLTIRGIAQPETLDVTVSGNTGEPVYHATGKIDRHAFGMAITRLDPVIGNPVDVTLDIRTVRLASTAVRRAGAAFEFANADRQMARGIFRIVSVRFSAREYGGDALGRQRR